MGNFIDARTIEEALTLIGRYGYLFVSLGALLQSVGLPLPAQTILLTAGVLAGQEILHPVPAIGFGVTGALAGSQIGYQIGSMGGRRFALRWGRYVGLTAERLEYAEKAFGRRARRTVLVARFVPFLKTFGYLTAGVILMPRRAFTLYDLVGTALWASLSVLIGYLASASIMELIE